MDTTLVQHAREFPPDEGTQPPDLDAEVYLFTRFLITSPLPVKELNELLNQHVEPQRLKEAQIYTDFTIGVIQALMAELIHPPKETAGKFFTRLLEVAEFLSSEYDSLNELFLPHLLELRQRNIVEGWYLNTPAQLILARVIQNIRRMTVPD